MPSHMMESEERPMMWTRAGEDFFQILSPLTWYRCAVLLLRIRWSSNTQRWLHHGVFGAALGLIALWCWLYWQLAFDAGQYLTLLSNFSQGTASIDDATSAFRTALPITCVRIVFVALVYSLILVSAGLLTSLWRLGLCRLFHQHQFSASGEYGVAALLWQTSTGVEQLSPAADENAEPLQLPLRLTSEIQQFTQHLSSALFGGLFFYGVLEMFPAIVVFAVYIVDQSGSASGVGFCFIGFIFCVLLEAVVSIAYSRLQVLALYYKGEMRQLLQRLLTFAESVAFLNGEESVELPRYRRLVRHLGQRLSMIAPAYSCVNYPIGLLGALGSLATYIMPAIFFFYLRSASNQTPADASQVLGTISSYSFLFAQLASILYVTEPVMLAAKLGIRLSRCENQLRELNCFWDSLATAERVQHSRRTNTAGEFEVRGVDLYCVSSFASANSPSRLQKNVCVGPIRSLKSLLITGRSGSGKTTLFRVCSGLRAVDEMYSRHLWSGLVSRESGRAAEPMAHPSTCYISTPLGCKAIFVPQRPYMPRGSIREQVLLLLEVQEQQAVADEQIVDLLETAGLGYLLSRFDLHSTHHWPDILSLGEQQKIGFLRLLAPVKLRSGGAGQSTLLFLDECSSGLDVASETRLYQELRKAGLWYISISHRPSLRDVHDEVVSFDDTSEAVGDFSRDRPLSPGDEKPNSGTEESPLLLTAVTQPTTPSSLTHTVSIELLRTSSSYISHASIEPSLLSPRSSAVNHQDAERRPHRGNHQIQTTAAQRVLHAGRARARLLLQLLQVLHCPFEHNQQGVHLRLKTYAAWAFALTCVFLHTYYTYQLSTETFEIFNVLGDYASGNISADDARATIQSQIGTVLALNLGTLAAYSCIMGTGQYIASLYTQRQSLYFGQRLLHDHTLYRLAKSALGRGTSPSIDTTIHQAVTVFSSDFHNLNSNLCFFLFGSIYYGGVFTIVTQCIALSRLLGLQPTGSQALAIVYTAQILLALLVFLSMQPYLHYSAHALRAYDVFLWMQQRVDLYAEQIALSAAPLRDREMQQLDRGLLVSVIAQGKNAIAYGLFCFFSFFSNQFNLVVAFVLPAVLFFNYSDLTVTTATNLISVSVYISFLQAYFIIINWGIGQAWTQVWTVGMRVLGTLREIEDAGDATSTSYVRAAISAAIELDHLDVYTDSPALHSSSPELLLIRDLSLQLPLGINLIITGASGCGKSTLLRILAGLSHGRGQNIRTLDRTQCIFLGQSMYLMKSSMAEQLQYCHRASSSSGAYGLNDAAMLRALDSVGLGQLRRRFTLTSVADWATVLSVGEQQRVLLASILLCASARCVFLDESTSACDMETELEFYQVLQRSGKQFVTVSHRPHLLHFHDVHLHIDADSKSAAMTVLRPERWSAVAYPGRGDGSG